MKIPVRVFRIFRGSISFLSWQPDFFILSGREQNENGARSKGERYWGLGEWPLGRGFEEAGA
jgi:hypothetical protein